MIGPNALPIPFFIMGISHLIYIHSSKNAYGALKHGTQKNYWWLISCLCVSSSVFLTELYFTFCPVDWSIYLHLQDQQSKMKALCSAETSVTLHQLTGRYFHQHLCESVMSHRIEDHAGPSCCVWCIFYGSVKNIAAFTEDPNWTYFSFHALWYIKTLVNTNKCTILQYVYSFYYVKELIERIHRL